MKTALALFVRDGHQAADWPYVDQVVRNHYELLGDIPPMTPDQISSRVREIEPLAFDNEVAHRMEDVLWEEVMTAIANGEAADPAACAKAVLETKAIDFTRWYA